MGSTALRMGVAGAAVGMLSRLGVLESGTMWSFARTSLLLLLGFVALLVTRQNGILYIPRVPGIPKENTSDPKEFADMPFEDVWVVTMDGVRLHGWLIKQKEDDSEANRAVPTILYFHGNAGNVSNRLPYYHELWKETEVNLLAVDYRGFGNCEGEPSEEGLKIDALAFLRFAQNHPDIDPMKLIVFGRSLGGAVAVDLLSSLAEISNDPPQVRGLIIENTFLSVKDMAYQVYPFLRLFEPLMKKPFLQNEWLSKEKISLVRKPILFISGGRDELIPPEQMRDLYRLCKRFPGTEFKLVPEGGHNDTPMHGGIEYYRCVDGFIHDCLSRLDSDFEEEPRETRTMTGHSVESILSEPDDFHLFS